jgi:hypothetical protein
MRVSLAAGDQDNGVKNSTFGATDTDVKRLFVMQRSAWEMRQRDDIEIVGLGACCDMFES